MFSRTGERLQQRHGVTSATRVPPQTVYLLGRLPAGRPLSLDQPILLLPRLLDVVLLLGLQFKRVSVFVTSQDTYLLLLDLKRGGSTGSTQQLII